VSSSHAEKYKPHPYKARNARHMHEEEQHEGLNQRIALAITNALGSIPCMYFFVILALIGFPGLHATPYQYVQWLSQTFIQLVALSVLGIAQNILNRQTEIQSDAMYETDIKTFRDTETLIEQGNESLQQNNEIIQQNAMIIQQNDEQIKMLTSLLTPKRRPMKMEEKP
jgi:hypothetical protein